MKKKIKKKIGDLTAEETIKILNKLSKSKILSQRLVYLYKGLITHLVFLHSETYLFSSRDMKKINENLKTRKMIEGYILNQGKKENEKEVEVE